MAANIQRRAGLWAIGLLALPAAAWGQTPVQYTGQPLYDNPTTSLALCSGASETGLAFCELLSAPSYNSPHFALIRAGSPPVVTNLLTPAGSPYGQFTSPSNDGTWLAGSDATSGFIYDIPAASYRIVNLPQWSSQGVLLTGISAINKAAPSSAPEFAGGFAYTNTSTCGQPFRYVSGRFVRIPVVSPCRFVTIGAESDTNGIAGTIGNALLFAAPGKKAITTIVPGTSSPTHGLPALVVTGVKDGVVAGTTYKGTGFIYNATTGHTALLPPIATPAGPIYPAVLGMLKSPQGGKYLVQTYPERTGFAGTYIYDGSAYTPVQITVAPVVAGDTVTAVYPAAVEEDGTITGSFTESCNTPGCTNVNESGFIAVPIK